MATFRFVEQPRAKNSNEPLTYVVTGPGRNTGTVKKQKNKWRLVLAGVPAEFDTKHQLRRHFQALGHTVEGLV